MARCEPHRPRVYEPRLLHRVLLEKVFPRQADVVTVDEWVAGLRST